MKKILYIICAIIALASCDKAVHDEPKTGNGFLSIALIWDDQLNSTDEIESVHLWIYNASGELAIERKYPSASDLALQKYELAKGNITVVVAVNVSEPIEVKHTATIDDLKYELARQSYLYEMTFYGDKTAEVVNGESRAVYVPLHDKPLDDTFINGEGDIKDWEEGDKDNGEILNPNK